MNGIAKEGRINTEITFCLKCNREVMPENILKKSTFIVNDDDYIVRIDDKLIHRGCGGILRTLPITDF